MRVEDLQHPTDRVVFETLVKLVRKVPWGPSRDALERHADEIEKSMEFVAVGNGGPRADDAMAWQMELYRLASEARFPREGDTVVARFVEDLVDDIRLLQEIGYATSPRSIRDVSVALESSLDALGFSLADLPLPPTLHELLDRGADRPDYVTEERWKAAEKSYYRQMTLDNTPYEFIYGDAGDHDFGDYEDSFDDEVGCDLANADEQEHSVAM